MNIRILTTTITSMLLALSTQAFAQSQSATEGKDAGSAATGSSTAPAKGSESFTHGESKRCESMTTAAEKDQCDKEEATKAQGAAAQEASKSTTEGKADGSAATGSSTAPAKGGQTFTHGESKRCESMTPAAEKDQCDKEEATKAQGAAAQEASKPQNAPAKE